MIRSGGGLIMVFAWVNNLFIQQDFQLDVDPHKSMVNGCCYKTKLVVVVVDMLDCSVDMHHCYVDTTELFHAYFFYVSAERLFSKIPYHTPYKT
jgi:hypothetical protein